MAAKGNRHDKDNRAYEDNNPLDGGTDRRVRDVVGNDHLESIASVIGGKDVPSIFNIAIANKSVEQSHTFPAGTKQFEIQLQGTAKLQIAFTSTESGTNYKTVHPGTLYKVENLHLTSGLTIYFQSSKDNEVLEVLAWS